MTTYTKVWEYVNPHIRPESFAKQSIALCKWFGDAYMLWESGGPGRQFGAVVTELSYGNVYYRKRNEAISGKVTDIPGIATTKEVKLIFLGEYRSAVEKGECVNTSIDALNETLEYVFASDGGPVHSRSVGKTDPSGAKANHGDRVIADALAWKGVKEYYVIKKAEKAEIKPGCLAWRNQRREKLEQEKSNDGW
jgi:hypothetical protein